MKFLLIISTAVRTVFANWKGLSKALFFPIVLTVLVNIINFIYFYKDDDFFYGPIELTTDIILLTLLAIPIHRFILLGSDSVSKWGFNKWFGRETTYWVSLMAMYYLIFMGAIVVGFIITKALGSDELPFEIALTLMPACLWIFSRWVMIFPALAIDSLGNLKRSWELTENNHISIFLVVLFFAILIFLPIYFLPKGYLQISIISAVVLIIVKIFAIASLSIAYKMFVDEKALASNTKT